MQIVHLLAFLAMLNVAAAQLGFGELDTMCAEDAGRMWGRSLCGPTMFVDPKTREAILRADGKVTTATLPPSVGIANTSIDWEGQRWTMVMWPLPEKEIERRSLLAHESFHRVQSELGFAATQPSNAHLDSLDGRYYLRMEWRALARALRTGEKVAVEDALAFRAKRHALGKNAAADERALEMHEGLAEHTGVALAEPRLHRRVAYLVQKLDAAEKSDGFVRNFAYASGPAWGTVIEMRDREWTRKLRPADDLGDVARKTWRVAAMERMDDDARAERYDGAIVRAYEEAREKKKQEERAALRAKFIDGPVLVLPLRQMQMVFDPNGLQPLDEAGTVYRTITISDQWGRIEVTNGALMSPDFTRLVVPAAEDGYTLSLSDGWARVKGAREGDETVRRADILVR